MMAVEQSHPNSTPGLVSIVLLNWNGRCFLHNCIQSIQKQTYQQYELLILDNCSSDGSQAVLQEQYHSYPLLLNQENLGYCGGANLGIRHTTGEYVLIINPDIILSPDFVELLVAAAQQDPMIGSVSGKLLRFDKITLDSTGQFLRRNLYPFERGYGMPDDGRYNRAEYVFSCCGAVAFYRRATLEDIRLGDDYFDEVYFAYYEDLDIGWRAQLLGWKAYYLPAAIAYHYRGGALGEQDQQPDKRRFFLLRFSFLKKPYFIQRHIIINRYLTLLKNASWRTLLRSLPSMAKIDIPLWGYVLFWRPHLLTTLIDLLYELPAAWRKRRYIQGRRTLTSRDIQQYIRTEL